MDEEEQFKIWDKQADEDPEIIKEAKKEDTEEDQRPEVSDFEELIIQSTKEESQQWAQEFGEDNDTSND